MEGAIILQGMHHSAQKSTRTGMVDSSTSFWKFADVRVTSTLMIAPWYMVDSPFYA
jgi:hypothetical protein